QRVETLRDRAPFDQVLVAAARLLRRGAAAAEIGAEILEVVPNVVAPVLFDVGIDAVDRPGIVVIQPGGEDAHAAQLTPPLVRIDIVWIVAARAGVAILADDHARHVAARERANGS